MRDVAVEELDRDTLRKWLWQRTGNHEHCAKHPAQASNLIEKMQDSGDAVIVDELVLREIAEQPRSGELSFGEPPPGVI
jgi:hypothetical protein